MADGAVLYDEVEHVSARSPDALPPSMRLLADARDALIGGLGEARDLLNFVAGEVVDAGKSSAQLLGLVATPPPDEASAAHAAGFLLRRLRGMSLELLVAMHLATNLETLIASDDRFGDETRTTPEWLSPAAPPLLRPRTSEYELRKPGFGGRFDSWSTVDREMAIRATLPWLTRLVDVLCDAPAAMASEDRQIAVSVAAGLLRLVEASPELLPERATAAETGSEWLREEAEYEAHMRVLAAWRPTSATTHMN